MSACVLSMRAATAAGLLPLAAVLGLLMPSSVAAKPFLAHSSRVTVVQGRHAHDVTRFAVRYRGSGSWHTTYASEPPNEGGAPDHDAASDSSTQRWSLRFASEIVLPRCLATRDEGASCAVSGLSKARGSTSASGVISHTHVDGLYPALNASASCHVHASSPSGVPLRVSLAVRYDRSRRAVVLRAFDPVAEALLLLPQACTTVADGIDGLLDNYFTPGFSFAPSFGPQRWFTSRAVSIPLRILRHAATVRVQLADTRYGAPPRACDVPAPSYERCATHGAWSGTLTLQARP